jgi:organic radical activating enzyme
MSNLFQSIKNFFSQKEPLPPGMYTYKTPPEAEEQYRLHLRIEKDGSGLLIINAATVLHLNQTAVEYAYHFIKGADVESVVTQVADRYQVEPEQAQQDYEDFLDKILTLIHTPDLDPVTYLDIERQQPYSGDISAPYRLDCALTYQVSDNSHLKTAPVERVDRTLTTQEWVSIFQKARDNGIPHLLFTGGEPTLREDLPEFIRAAEELGLVTGLLTDGLKLDDDDYRQGLIKNGLDHIMVVFDPSNEALWSTLQKILAEDCFTTVHLTLNKGENLHHVIARLARMGANALSLSTADEDLTDELQKLRDTAAFNQLELVWDLPVPYCRNNPVRLELQRDAEQRAPQGAGKAWLYVEPDGDVLPAQGMYEQILGNMLRDPWDQIWEKS